MTHRRSVGGRFPYEVLEPLHRGCRGTAPAGPLRDSLALILEAISALPHAGRSDELGAAITAEGAEGVREGRSLPDLLPVQGTFQADEVNTASVASVVRSLVISPRSLLLGSGGICLAIWGPHQRDPVGAGTPSIPGIAQPGETPCRKARQ
jgi:hypothetical protein